jgi:NAD-reducing hydrogenase large subunit
MANLIVSTTSNNEPMNRAVARSPRTISGKEITEGLLNHVEVAIRAYDPCLSCATHAMGQMPLTATATPVVSMTAWAAPWPTR